MTSGQHAQLTFTGTLGQKVSMAPEFRTLTNCAKYTILNPDNSTLVASTDQCGYGMVRNAPIVRNSGDTLPIAPIS